MFEGCMIESRRRPDSNTKLVAEQAAHLLEIAVLLVNLHRDAVTEVVRLEHWVVDQAP